jgi:hypothetical protein
MVFFLLIELERLRLLVGSVVRSALLSNTLYNEAKYNFSIFFAILCYVMLCIFFVRGAVGPEKSPRGAQDVLS